MNRARVAKPFIGITEIHSTTGDTAASNNLLFSNRSLHPPENTITCDGPFNRKFEMTVILILIPMIP